MNRLSQIVPLQHDSIVSPYPAAGWRAAFADLGRKGFTGVEIAVTYPERIDVPALCRAAAENHLAVTTISTGQSYWEEGISLTAPDPAVRARAAAIVRGHVDLSARIGHPPVTIGLLRGQPEDGAAALELLAQELLPLAAYAAGRGVVLQVEPIRRIETTLLNSTAETLAFLHRLGDPANVGVLFDTFNSSLEDGDVAAAARLAAGRITNLHVVDSDCTLPGCGTLDLPAVLAAALEAGYAGAFTLETLNLPSREYVLEHEAEALHRTVQAARRLRASAATE